MQQVKQMAINHLMRNIDREISNKEKETYLFTNNTKNELAFILIAAALRPVKSTIHTYFCKESEVLEPLPLSLNSFCMATADKYELISDYKIDEEEDVHMTLNVPQCKEYLKEVYKFINESSPLITSKLLNQYRECPCTIVENS